MPAFIVFKVSGTDVPPLGQTGSADVYRGDHVTELDAVNAAAAAWRLPPGVRMWADDQGNLTRYVTASSAAPG